jgi:hypothetical protein
MYIHTQIPAEIVPYLWNIYNNKYKSDSNTFTNISFTPSIQHHPDILDLLLKSKYIMEMYGFKFRCKDSDIIDNNKENESDEYDWLIEFHHYKIHDYYEPEFTRHMDDQSGISANVNTIIFYLNKDNTIQGGNLIVNDNGIDKKIKIKSGDMIIMRGDVYHEIEPMGGNGNRMSIVVQLQRD